VAVREIHWLVRNGRILRDRRPGWLLKLRVLTQCLLKQSYQTGNKWLLRYVNAKSCFKLSFFGICKSFATLFTSDSATSRNQKLHYFPVWRKYCPALWVFDWNSLPDFLFVFVISTFQVAAHVWIEKCELKTSVFSSGKFSRVSLSFTALQDFSSTCISKYSYDLRSIGWKWDTVREGTSVLTQR
jgi:hypothetical protein